MIQRVVTLPEMILLVGTRVALGLGVGFLVSEKLSPEARRAAGWALVVVGAVTTFPIAMGILSKPEND